MIIKDIPRLRELLLKAHQTNINPTQQDWVLARELLEIFGLTDTYRNKYYSQKRKAIFDEISKSCRALCCDCLSEDQLVLVKCSRNGHFDRELGVIQKITPEYRVDVKLNNGGRRLFHPFSIRKPNKEPDKNSPYPSEIIRISTAIYQDE